MAQTTDGVAVGPSGRLYITDEIANVVHEYNPATEYETLFAGNGQPPGCGPPYEPATAACLSDPYGAAVDSHGNVLFTNTYDTSVEVVAAITGSFYGQSMTADDMYDIAGNGSVGCTYGGSAVHANLNDPTGLAFDANGNVLIADQGCDTIDVVPLSSGTFYGQSMAAGDIYDIAGIGATFGYSGDGGPATSAEMAQSAGVAVDASGNVLIADQYNNRVRVVAATTGTFYGQSMTAGDIYTVAGDGTGGNTGNGGPGTSAEVELPADVAVDAHGNVIIPSFSGSDRVLAESTGTFYGQSMSAGDIYSLATGNDRGVAVDGAGNLVFAEYGFIVRVVAGSTGTFYGQSMAAGNAYAIAGDYQEYQPSSVGDVTVGGQGNTLYSNSSLGSVNMEAAATGTFFGQAMTAGSTLTIASGLDYPDGVAFDAYGNAVIADVDHQRVEVTANATGTFYGQSMTAGLTYTVVGNGTGGYAGNGGPAISAELDYPEGVAIDAAGNIVVSDSGNDVTRVVAESTGTFYGQSMTAGDIYTVAGNGTGGYGGNGGPATAAELDFPEGVALDAAGNIVVSDSGNDVIRVVAKSSGNFYGQSMTAGDIYTVAGDAAAGYSGDGGPATSAELDYPEGVVVDADGNLTISDTENNRVRVVAESAGTNYAQPMTVGNIYTVAGNGTAGYSGDGGPATSAELYSPGGVTVSPQGDLVIADTDNGVIRSVQGGPPTRPTIQPQGEAVGADTYGGGSPSQKCSCSRAAPPETGSVADPVDPATGDFHETTTDLALPGAGVPLGFTRTYDAQAAQAQEAIGSAPPLGYGWADNLGMSVSYNALTQVATVTEENGAQDNFTPYVSGTSPAWCTGATNFCASAPRIEATLNQNGGGTWTYVRTTGGQSTFTFGTSGALSSITDSAGDSLSSSAYSPGSGQTACPVSNTCVAWTSSASGRELVLATNGSGQLTSVFDANSTLSTSFSYSGSGCTSWGGSQTPELCTATDPGSLITSYTYDSGNSTSSLDYDMLTETPPGASGQTTNVYNTSGEITQQTDPSGAVTTLSYSGTNSSLGGGTTTVTSYPLGTGSGEPQNTTTYQYSSNVLIAETTGVGTSSASTQAFGRDPASLLALWVEDGDGNVGSDTLQTYSGSGGTSTSSANVLTSTDALGNTSQDAYNADNQAWCTVDAADFANGTRCPSSAPTSPPSPGSSDPDLGTTINFYNSSDQLTATTDPLGNTTTYSYTSGISGVPSGLQYCSVDPVNYQKSVTCPAYGATHVTGTTTAAFDSAGDKTSSTDADGDTTSYAYSITGHPGLVSSQTDPDGTATTFTYNGASEVNSQVVSFGSYSATTLYAYDSLGRKFCEVDPYEFARSVTCPSSPPSSPPTPSSDPYLGATITTYDADGRVIQSTNPLGGITYTAYDDAGNQFCTVGPTEAAVGVTCPSSAPSTPPTPSSDPYLGATITTYDADGRVIQSTNPLGGITLTVYDGANNVIQTTVESNNATSDPSVVTENTYDADNRVISTTVGYGSSAPSITLSNYDPDGNVFCSVSANAVAAGPTAYQCPSWQPGWITAAPNPSALYSSSPNSAQADNVTTTFFNADGQQLQSTNPDLQTTVSAYNGDGNSYCNSDPTNVSTWVTAHPLGTYPYLCPSTPPTTAPTSTTTGYTTTIFDAAGHTNSSTDQVGDTTSYTYDPAGHQLTMVDPRGETTTSCYYWENATGQCAHSAPAGGGSGDDLYSQTTPATAADPSGETTTTTYYPGDEPDATTTPAGTTTDSYDALVDLTGVAYSGTASGYSAPANVSYTYNVDGSRHTMTDGTGTTTYTDDAMGDVTQQQFSATGTGLTSNTVGYSYFTTGALASVTYPSYSGHMSPGATYTYDALGNMGQVTDWLGNNITFSHDEDGNLTSQDNAVSGSNPSGTSSTSFSYDNADLSTQAASTLDCSGTDGTLTQSFSGSTGSSNADGQVTEDSESYSGSCAGPSSYERNYSYDGAGRVVYQGTTAQGSNANNVAYDASGDPTTISSHDSSANFDTYTQAFDASGEVTSQTPVSGSHGVTATYSYNTLGNQTQGVAGSATSNYGFNQVGEMTSFSQTNSTTYQYTGDGLEAASQISGRIIWTPPTDVDSTRAIDASTCVSSSFCVAVGASGYATIYNGTSWSAASDVDSTRTLDAVSCVSSSFCVAVDTSGYDTIYNGTSWSTPADIDSTRSINAVQCASTSFCVAVGASGYDTIYNGTSWSTAADIDSTRTLDVVSCVSSTFCEAADTSGFAAKYTGSWATAADIDSTRSIDTLTCVSTSFCVAAGASGYDTIYNGSSWSTPADIDSTRTIKAVACPTASVCVAVDTSGYATTYNGTSWATATDIDGSHGLEALSCASSTSCDTTDNAGNLLTYNGSAWSTTTDIDAARSVNSVSCPTTTFCAAADGSGYAAIYALTSQSWTPPTDVDSTRAIDASTCVSSSFCVAVGASGYATIYNGTSWSAASDVDSTRTLDAVSCVSSSFCVAVDTSGYDTIYNGTSWSTPADIDSTRSINAVQCASTSFCVAVGASGYDTIYNGTSWSTAADIDSTRTLDVVSCVSSTFCEAADTSGFAAKYTGSWATAADIDSTRSIDTLTCVSTSFCVAAGASGYDTIYNGSSWSTPADIDSTRTIKAVACPTASVCVAVDTSGYATTYNGTSWATATDIDGSNALEALSCASSTSCDTTDNAGNLLTYNGSAWSTTTDIDAARSVNSVSCPTTTFCAAADGSGFVAVYQTLSETLQLTWNRNSGLSTVLSDSINDYIYGPTGEPVEQVSISGSSPTFLTYTPTDSSWLATNNAGQQLAFWRYDAFGTLTLGTPDSPFGYAGQYTDDTSTNPSGLSNMRARWYDAQTGEFTTRDPAFSNTDQAYLYVGDDPVNEIDPTGRYKKLRTLASTNVRGYYAAINWVTTGNKGIVQDGMVRVQFQLSARSLLAKAEVEDIRASICDTYGNGCTFDRATIPIQLTAHPSTLAWPGDDIQIYGYVTGSDFFSSYTITFVGRATAPWPNPPAIFTTSSVSWQGPPQSNSAACGSGALV